MKTINDYIAEKANFIAKKHASHNNDSEVDEFCRFVCEFYKCNYDSPDDDAEKFVVWFISDDNMQSLRRLKSYLEKSKYKDSIRCDMMDSYMMSIYYDDIQIMRVIKNALVSGGSNKLLKYKYENNK